MSTVKVGDVVMLKSSGPVMTVTKKGGYHHGASLTNSEVVCQWFSSDCSFVTECVCDEAALSPVTVTPGKSDGTE